MVIAMVETPDGHGQLVEGYGDSLQLCYVRGPEGIIVAVSDTDLELQ